MRLRPPRHVHTDRRVLRPLYWRTLNSRTHTTTAPDAARTIRTHTQTVPMYTDIQVRIEPHRRTNHMSHLQTHVHTYTTHVPFLHSSPSTFPVRERTGRLLRTGTNGTVRDRRRAPEPCRGGGPRRGSRGPSATNGPVHEGGAHTVRPHPRVPGDVDVSQRGSGTSPRPPWGLDGGNRTGPVSVTVRLSGPVPVWTLVWFRRRVGSFVPQPDTKD